jgi:hypothetical protein
MIDDTIRIKMTRNVRPDFPLGLVGGIAPGTVLRAGEVYDATSNKHGAICGICANGKTLGVRPGEFEFIEAPEWVLKIWRKTEGYENA